MNINKLIINTTTVQQLNKKYKTNISICPTKVNNPTKRKMFKGQTEVLSRTTRDAVKSAMNTLSKKSKDCLYTAILLCGFDNGSPKNEAVVAKTLKSGRLYVHSMINDGILSLQNIALDPSIQVHTDTIHATTDDTLDEAQA